MKIVIEGDDSAVANIIRENKLRESRGLVSIEVVDSTGSRRGRKKSEPEPESKAQVEPEPKQEPKGLKE